MQNKLILSGSSPAHRELAELTMPNHQAYAQQMGWKYEHAPFPDGEGSWPKLDFICDLLPQYEEILWIDSDAIFTWTEELPSSRCPLVLSSDINGPCAGIMLIQNRLQTDMFFNACRLSRSLFADHPWWDQAAIRHFLGQHPYTTDDLFSDLPMSTYFKHHMVDYSLYPEYKNIKSIGAVSWKPNSWILHLPGLPLETRIKILKERMPKL